MCKCHKVNPATKKWERVLFDTSIGSLTPNEQFYFPDSPTVVRSLISQTSTDFYCPPLDGSGYFDERQTHVFNRYAKIHVLENQLPQMN